MEHTGQSVIESQSHTFSRAEQDIIYELATKMKYVGIFNFISVGLLGLGGLIMLFIKTPIGIIYLLCVIPGVFLGIWTLDASSSFKMMLDIAGTEITDLMSALDSLRKIYTLQFWMVVIVWCLCVVAIILAALVVLFTRVH